MLLENLFCGRQTKACAESLGTVERLETVLQRLPIHPDSVVNDLDNGPIFHKSG